MPLPALAIPVIMTGARAVTRVAAKEAAKLIAAGKARYAKNVVKDIEKAITQIRGKGKGAPKMPPLASTARKRTAAAAAKRKAADAIAQKKTAVARAMGSKEVKTAVAADAKRKATAAAAKTKPAGKTYEWTFKGKKASAKPSTAQQRLKKATGTAAPKPGTKTGTSTAQQRLRRATGAATGAPKLPIGKGTKGALPTATTSKLSFARRPKGRGKRTGLKEVGAAAAIAGGVGFFAGTGDTKSVTVKSGDTLSQIAKDNNTTIAAIKKANPSITNIHLITPGQKIKVPKVKGRKSVYQGMTTSELQQPKKTTTTAAKIKYGPPGSYGASKTGGIVKRRAGGKVKKYKEGRTIGGASKSGPKALPIKVGINKGMGHWTGKGDKLSSWGRKG